MPREHRHLRYLIAAVALGVSPGAALADVPAGYKGTPYMGKAQVIPGRVELANLDLGGEGVAYHADHRRVNAVREGYSPLSGDDYRVGDLDLPDICRTNNFAPPDTWDDGKPYPTAARELWYYMGLAHSVDWVKVTVDVKQAGTYNVSTNFASAETQTGCSIWFNDGTAPANAADTHLDGVNKSGNLSFAGTGQYHTWKAYPNLATVTLGAGVQVMTFHLRQNHLQYGFLQFDLVGGTDGGAGGASGPADAGPTDAAGPMGGAGGGAAGAPGSMGNAGAPGAAGSRGAGGDVEMGGATGAAGTADGSAGGAQGTAGTGGGSPGATAPSSGGGCACALPPRGGEPSSLLGLVLLCVGWSGFRRRSVRKRSPRRPCRRRD